MSMSLLNYYYIRQELVDSYTAMKRMACNISGWKAANQSND